ncbi:TRAP transporter small permease [Aquabacterium sp. J223]|uniref:TRAP transporter small permease n=1 Tax=Aquabacterium sp. J223 TaxID=2898431 RepID=UPI0021AD6AFF|nr:TRAP transporter small permease [Aquabacterium sp. J223]UUX97145.1 TRAP transporter small permease [Aquabacterium sp. J223]
MSAAAAAAMAADASTLSSPAATSARRAGRLRRGLDGLYAAGAVAGAVCIALIALLMVWQSVGRQLGIGTGAVNDLVAWLCAAAGFLTMAGAFRHGDFVRVSLLLETLSPPARRRAELATLGIAAVSVAYLAWWACRFTFDSWRFKEMAQGLLPIPIWIPQSSFAAGSLLLLVAVIDEWVGVARGSMPTYERLTAERHAAGDFSSDL